MQYSFPNVQTLINRVKKPDEFNRPRIPIPQRKVKRKSVYLTKKVSCHPSLSYLNPHHPRWCTWNSENFYSPSRWSNRIYFEYSKYLAYDGFSYYNVVSTEGQILCICKSCFNTVIYIQKSIFWRVLCIIACFISMMLLLLFWESSLFVHIHILNKAT